MKGKLKLNKNYELCIDTTSRVCSVALFEYKNLLDEINLNVGLNHSITLFESINKILKNNNVNIENLKKINVASGPGSFTGIRIGIAAALGLSKSKNIKINYIDSLDSLANNIKEKKSIIISMIDAKVNRIYFSIYKFNVKNKLLNDMIIDIDILFDKLNKKFTNNNINFIFVGDAINIYYNKFDKLKINYLLCNDTLQKASSLFGIKGNISYKPIINYMLASKAERDKINDKS